MKSGHELVLNFIITCIDVHVDLRYEDIIQRIDLSDLALPFFYYPYETDTPLPLWAFYLPESKTGKL